jgi:hypothetical protein
VGGAEIASVGYALAMREVDEMEVVERRRVCVEKVATGVSGGVVDDDDFVRESDGSTEGDEGLAETGTFVVNGKGDRELGPTAYVSVTAHGNPLETNA